MVRWQGKDETKHENNRLVELDAPQRPSTMTASSEPPGTWRESKGWEVLVLIGQVAVIKVSGYVHLLPVCTARFSPLSPTLPHL
jgi:hypothetical protein